MQRLKIWAKILLVGFMASSTPLQANTATAQDSVNATTEVSWTFDAAIKQGEIDKLKALIGEMSAQAEATEPGTLTYQWSISEDNLHGQTFERYRNSEAALTHLASFNKNFAKRLMAMVEPKGMVVYGKASAALKQELAGADPVYMQRVDGFAR